MSFKRFSISGNAGTANTTAATNGLIMVQTTAATRALLYEFDVASAAAAAPVDQNYQVILRRFSGGAGTWTSATPAPLDPADAAAVCLGGVAKTADITTPGTTLFTIGFNARAGFRWVAIPDSEFVAASTVNAGIEMKYTAVSGGTDINACTFLYQE
jgi:hypothetical protein